MVTCKLVFFFRRIRRNLHLKLLVQKVRGRDSQQHQGERVDSRVAYGKGRGRQGKHRHRDTEPFSTTKFSKVNPGLNQLGMYY